MQPSFARFVSRVLIASMIVLPFQAQAGVIGTGQAVAAARDQDVHTAHGQSARATLASYVGRADVAAHLQTLGLSPQAAKERVAALTDAEVATLAGGIDSLPAGAFASGFFGLLLVAIFLLWRFAYSADAKDPAKK